MHLACECFEFQTSALDVVATCLNTFGEVSLYTYAAARKLETQTLGSGAAWRMLHGDLSAAARLAGLDGSVVCRAILNIEAEVMRRLDTENVSSLFALANVIGAPRHPLGEGAGHDHQTQGARQSETFECIIQRFFPFMFLSPSSQRRLSDCALPRLGCRSVPMLLDHWERKWQCVVETPLASDTGMDCWGRRSDTTAYWGACARRNDEGSENTVNTFKEAPAAQVFVRELAASVSGIFWLMESSTVENQVVPQWASTPTQFVQTLREYVLCVAGLWHRYFNTHSKFRNR